MRRFRFRIVVILSEKYLKYSDKQLCINYKQWRIVQTRNYEIHVECTLSKDYLLFYGADLYCR